MHKIDLKEKKEILNIRKITFVAILFILLFIVASILLLIWWPVKATFTEITNSWVAVIMVYLVLIIFLYDKPIYKYYNKFVDSKTSRRRNSQQLKRINSLITFSGSDFTDIVSYHDIKWDNILKDINQDRDSSLIKNNEIVKYIEELQDENIKLRFLYADTYLVLYAKYVLFWLYKSKSVSREEFENTWKPKISDYEEREAILNALFDLKFAREEEEEEEEKKNTLIINELGLAYVDYLKKIDEKIGK